MTPEAPETFRKVEPVWSVLGGCFTCGETNGLYPTARTGSKRVQTLRLGYTFLNAVHQTLNQQSVFQSAATVRVT